MTAAAFIKEIEDSWAKEFTAAQAEVWRRKLDRFENWQLDDLLEKVIETCRYRPKFSEVWTIAKELGYFKDEMRAMRTTSEHTWTPTDCRLCGGEGRLYVYFEHYAREGHWEKRQTRIFGYCSPEAKDYAPAVGEEPYLFRCSCSAGDAVTLPESYPKLGGLSENEVPF